MTFAEQAGRLAGLAGLIFGWRPDEFWSATPAELATLLHALPQPPCPPLGDDMDKLKERFPDG
jgi:hypothetical protein